MFKGETTILILCLLPVGGAALAALLPGIARIPAILSMLAVLLISADLFVAFDGISPAAELNIAWIDSLGVDLHLGVDGLNLYFVLLTAILFPVVLGCSWRTNQARSRLFLSLVLLLQASLMATFLSQNLMLFFIFWEAVLIPMSILILVFGGQKSRKAAQAFFLYTLAGSVLLLAAVILLGVEAWKQTGSWTFEFDALMALSLGWETQLFVFVAVFFACAIKCPLFPFHSWLPIAYGEAPASGTALMSGVLSKMGAFALLKLAIPLCPEVSAAFAPAAILLAVVSIIYGAVLALRQENYKMLVAYSSLSHMGYIVLGLFSFQETALHGALFQVLSHGVAVAGLFLLLGLLEERLGSAYLRTRALSTTAPRLAVVLMILVLASVALPLTSGFTSEFMILLGAFQAALPVWLSGGGLIPLLPVVLACSGMVLGAVYMLRFARAILFGKSEGTVADLGLREALVFLPILVLVFAIGIYPAPFMKKGEGAVIAVIDRATSPSAPLASNTNTFEIGGAHGN